MTTLREAAQQALEALEKPTYDDFGEWVSGLQSARDALRAALAEPQRRLTDAQIGEVWFRAKLPGVTETTARILIRAAEQAAAERPCNTGPESELHGY